MVGRKPGRFWAKVMFRFKKFAVHQENSAMKVCTDACTFGAIIQAKNPKHILDIGTGTGLLALMLAQRFHNSKIDAVEIDDGACSDAKKNFQASPFSEQLEIHKDSIQNYSKNSKQKYDLVISNPPFYKNQLTSPNEKRNIAHHSSVLTLLELTTLTLMFLEEEGAFWVLLPPVEMEKLRVVCKNHGLYIHTAYQIKHNENKPVFREIVEFRKTRNVNPAISVLCIYENANYSSTFAALLKDYYLKF